MIFAYKNKVTLSKSMILNPKKDFFVLLLVGSLSGLIKAYYLRLH